MTAALRLFGAPALDDGGETLALPFERRSQLLVYLALKQTWVRRAELAALLWPEQASKLALTNLRKTLFRLAAFAGAAPIEQHGGALRSTAPTDVADFELALREGRRDDALALRRGELLAGFDDDANDAWSSWLGFERDRLRVAWRGAALERIAGEIEPVPAVELSAQLLAADPLDEVAMQAHLSALARSGEVARARRTYRDFSDRLVVELGLTPGHELRALNDRLAAGAVKAAPAPAETTPSVAGAPGDGFIGRTVELRRIAAMLAGSECRLLTLVGPGGIGKTRLVQRALAELAPRFADGAAYVALDALGAPAQLADRIARELGIALSRTGDAFESLVGFLRSRETLLVLDNFEHLTAAASVVDALLGACPGLRVLVTSRVRLALAAEHLLPVEGLPFPDAEDIDQAQSFDAVRLFVQTAQRVEPGLVPAVEAAAIADICRQVEGLPLAIELAATWTRVLSCDAIAAELRQGSDLLAAADATQPARHASIDVVFEQSWSMLGASEREALARLAIFRGGFSAESARAVAAASLPVLGALGDKSLLRKDRARLSLHPLVQQLAGQRLDSTLHGALEQAHGFHFHRLLAQLRRGAESGDHAALQQIETELENCRVAWRWAIRTGRGDLLVESVATLLSFWDHRSRVHEGLALVDEAIQPIAAGAAPSTGDDSERRVWVPLAAAQAHLEYRLDRYAPAVANATRALAMTRSGDEADHDSRLLCFKVLGACALRQDRLEDAKRHFEQALHQAPAGRDPHNAASMLDNLALVHKALGDYDRALPLSLESLAQHRSLGDAAGVALCLNNLAVLQCDQGEIGSVESYLLEALAISERHGFSQTRALVLANLTDFEVQRGKLDAAAMYGARAIELGRAAGHRSVVAVVELLLARCAFLQGDVDLAKARLVEGMKLSNEIGRRPLQVFGLSTFADLLIARGEVGVGRQLFVYLADQLDSKVERDRVKALLAGLPAPEETDAGAPAMTLAELARRIVIEAAVDHAPLIAALHERR